MKNWIRCFSTRIPRRLEDELEIGMEVFIPFGKGNRRTKGYVTAISETMRL